MSNMLENKFNSILCLNTFINNVKKNQQVKAEQHKINYFKTTNNFLRYFKIKKQKKQLLNNNISKFSEQKKTNFKYFNFKVFTRRSAEFLKKYKFVTYIITIQFSRTNTFIQIMDFSGKLLFFHSAGTFRFSGRTKKSRYNVFHTFYKDLRVKLKFLKGKPISLHLKNVGPSRFWIISKLKKKFFLQSIKIFENFPYNGCKKKKNEKEKI